MVKRRWSRVLLAMYITSRGGASYPAACRSATVAAPLRVHGVGQAHYTAKAPAVAGRGALWRERRMRVWLLGYLRIGEQVAGAGSLASRYFPMR